MDSQDKDFYELQHRVAEDGADDELRQTDAAGVATGTKEDAMDMARLGRTQEFRRSFKSFSNLGMAAGTSTQSYWTLMAGADVGGSDYGNLDCDIAGFNLWSD